MSSAQKCIKPSAAKSKGKGKKSNSSFGKIDKVNKKTLLKLSKKELIKKCKKYKVSSVGSKKDMIDRIILKSSKNKPKSDKNKSNVKSKKKSKDKGKKNKSDIKSISNDTSTAKKSKRKKKKKKTDKSKPKITSTTKFDHKEEHEQKDEHQNGFVYTPLTTELLIYGFCHQLEEEEDLYILPPLIDIMITYYTHVGQFYFDPIGYNQKVWNHTQYKRSLTVDEKIDIKLLNKAYRHCVYILYNNGAINTSSNHYWTNREDRKLYYCTLRYNGKTKDSESNAFFECVTRKDLSLLNKKNKDYKSNIKCGWKDNECITIELDLDRHKIYYHKSYGNEKYFKRYTQMTKRIPMSKNYYFMLCGNIQKGDSYTLMSIAGSNIDHHKVKPILFM